MLEQLPQAWWIYVVLGVVAGIVSGMLGIGSGSVVVPALVIFCAFGQKNAQGIALAVMVPMALVGAYRYWHNPEIDLNLAVALFIALGAVVGTLIGTELVTHIPAALLKKLFAIFLIVVAVKMFFSPD